MHGEASRRRFWAFKQRKPLCPSLHVRAHAHSRTAFGHKQEGTRTRSRTRGPFSPPPKPAAALKTVTCPTGAPSARRAQLLRTRLDISGRDSAQTLPHPERKRSSETAGVFFFPFFRPHDDPLNTSAE